MNNRAIFIIATCSAIFPTWAKVEYRVRGAETALFGNPELKPPPIKILGQGDGLEMLRKGTAASWVRHEGISGWMANADIQAVVPADDQWHQLGDQNVTGKFEMPSIDVWVARSPEVKLAELERNFSDEIVEFADREEMVIRHDEN